MGRVTIRPPDDTATRRKTLPRHRGLSLNKLPAKDPSRHDPSFSPCTVIPRR